MNTHRALLRLRCPIGHTAALTLALLAACAAPGGDRAPVEDPLPSWTEGPRKADLLDFVERVTDSDGPEYVPPAERVAVFDNDGTLWCEKPFYTQLAFGLEHLRELADEHPEWQESPALRAALDGDLAGLAATGERGLLDVVLGSHAGTTPEEFQALVDAWLATARHPRFERSYTALVYQPMLELMGHLRAHGFAVWIVSGGGNDFLRAFADEVYDVPPERIIGSTMALRFELDEEGRARLVREPRIDFIDDKEGKPIAIERRIGRRPILAFGNSDGDLAMLQWTAAGEGPRLMGFVHHTDADREYAYDRESSVGRLDAGLDAARAGGWTVVDMARDWRRVFAFE